MSYESRVTVLHLTWEAELLAKIVAYKSYHIFSSSMQDISCLDTEDLYLERIE